MVVVTEGEDSLFAYVSRTMNMCVCMTQTDVCLSLLLFPRFCFGVRTREREAEVCGDMPAWQGGTLTSARYDVME